MIETLFPNGVISYAIGGLMVGLGVLFIYFLTAKIPGASTFLESTLSYISDKQRFQKYTDSRGWRITFTAGIVLGALIHTVFFRQGGFWTTEISSLRLFLGGILVGVGTRIGKGCTSGHGVNGIGSLSKASFAGVISFLGAAIITAQTVTALGVMP